MKPHRSILAMLAAVAISVGVTLPVFAKPAVLTGQQPGSRINVRSQPTTASASRHYGLVGDRVETLDQTQGEDGYNWYYVRFRSGAEGWVRQDFVRVLNTTRSAYLNGGSPGARINVRSAPTVQAASPHYGMDGDRVTVLKQTEGRDGYVWYYIRFRSGAEGWVRGDLVQLIG